MVVGYSEGSGWGQNRAICHSCDKERSLRDVKSLDQTAWFCVECIQKFGAETLRRAADAALAVKNVPKALPVTNCIRCSDALVPGISRGLMCHACNGAYRERFGRNVQWGPAPKKEG